MTGTGWGGYVVAGTPVRFVGAAVEVLLNNLLSSGESVASAHREIMTETFRTDSAWTKIGASPE
jgi:hypothetical protein